MVYYFKRWYRFSSGVVVKGEAKDKTFNMEQTLNKEDSVTIVGYIKKEPRSIGGYRNECN